MWATIIRITIIGLVTAERFVEPAPAKSFGTAAGSEGEAYYTFANRHHTLLAQHDIPLEVVETAGSIENLELLEAGKVAGAFVQGGAAAATSAEGLESLASLYFEPIWVFHRKSLKLEYLE